MPNGMEMNREDWKQLAELMLEYPTEQGDQEEGVEKRRIVDTTHAYDASSHLKRQPGRQSTPNTRQNADRYIREKFPKANATNTAETSDGHQSYENTDDMYAQTRAGAQLT